MGLIAMSERDLQRIETLSKVVAGRMTMVSAAHVLDLSERQVRRLLERIRTGGAASIRRKAIGRPSNTRISDGVRDYAMTLVRERYAYFWPTPAAEKLAERDGFQSIAVTLIRLLTTSARNNGGNRSYLVRQSATTFPSGVPVVRLCGG